MSRFYLLNILDKGGKVVKAWTSHPNGNYDPRAQNIIFDIPVTSYDVPSGGSVVTMEGVSLTALNENKNYAGYYLELYAGMAHGLPLANIQPAPALILQGQILEAFGNWVGNEMNLSFVIAATGREPGNFSFTWTKGQTLQSALTNTFNTAMPGITQQYAISSALVATHTEHGYYTHLEHFAQHIYDRTAGLASMGANYPGVRIAYQRGKLVLWDQTEQQPTTKLLRFEDLVGQPTWTDSDTLDVTVVLRPDIQVGDKVRMPQILASLPGIVTTIPSVNNAFQDYILTFSGEFFVTKLRYLADFRASQGQYWVSVIRCAGSPPA